MKQSRNKLYKGFVAIFPPKHVAAQAFQPMLDKICNTCNRWKSFHFSYAAKEILINSCILSIPTYNLSVYPIPDSILSEISKVVRKFFWSRGSNGKGIHNVCWNVITESKPKWGLGIRNLVITKHSLTAKHVFRYLNNDNVF